MIKKHKWTLILSSAVTLLPMILAAFATKFLPPEIAVHWGGDGSANGWMSSVAFFLIIPPVMLAFHWLCVLITAVVDKNNKKNEKMLRLVFWIIPAITLACCGTIFTAALGNDKGVFTIMLLLIGIMLIFIGNYLPKTTRNVTMGIKIKWTFSSDENWNATHRFTGKVYFITGFVCLSLIPLPALAVCIAAPLLLIPLCVMPLVYSYRYYKKQLASGSLTKAAASKNIKELTSFKGRKTIIIISSVILAALLILCGVIMFTGKVENSLGDSKITLDASFVGSVEVDYKDINYVELREANIGGVKVSGFNSTKILAGSFKNDELGVHVRYTTADPEAVIIFKTDKATYVISGKDKTETLELYIELMKKTNLVNEGA